jgi:ketosteroid isomerase-like protein
MDRLSRARSCYLAFASGDREAIEDLFTDDLTFSSPADVALDRGGYFERCWPYSGERQAFDFKRLLEIGDDEVLVTYESERADGSRIRNTEVLGFSGDKIRRVEVYWGWNVSGPR